MECLCEVKLCRLSVTLVTLMTLLNSQVHGEQIEYPLITIVNKINKKKLPKIKLLLDHETLHFGKIG